MKQKALFALFLVSLVLIAVYSCTSTTPVAPATATPVPAVGTATLTSTITQTFTVSPTYTVTHDPYIDNCDDNDNVDNWGGYWVTFDDQANAGTSYVWPWSDPYATSHGLTPMLFAMSSPGYGGSGYAARITGYTTAAYQYRFIGMGAQLSSTAGASGGCYDVDISNFTGVSFWAKGDGTNFIVIIPYTASYPLTTCDSASLVGYADYGYILSALSASWTQFTIPFTSFTQPSWVAPANVVPINTVLRHAKQIQFKTYDLASSHDAGVDLWVDDLTFY